MKTAPEPQENELSDHVSNFYVNFAFQGEKLG